MRKNLKYSIIFFVMVGIATTMYQPAAAKDTPNLSSSIAKNLWRQCQFYFEEAMDAKALRACEEMRAWASENNEPAIEAEMSGMLKTLKGRQKAPAAPAPKKEKRKLAVAANQPGCGYGSISEMPSHVLIKMVTTVQPDFVACTQDSDCVKAKGFCGSIVAVNATSQQCFEAASKYYSDEVVKCVPMDPFKGTVACKKERCVFQFGY